MATHSLCGLMLYSQSHMAMLQKVCSHGDDMIRLCQGVLALICLSFYLCIYICLYFCSCTGLIMVWISCHLCLIMHPCDVAPQQISTQT